MVGTCAECSVCAVQLRLIPSRSKGGCHNSALRVKRLSALVTVERE